MGNFLPPKPDSPSTYTRNLKGSPSSPTLNNNETKNSARSTNREIKRNRSSIAVTQNRHDSANKLSSAAKSGIHSRKQSQQPPEAPLSVAGVIINHSVGSISEIRSEVDLSQEELKADMNEEETLA